jgi:hypothetical protein
MSKREDECFGGRRRGEQDWFGLASFGFFLILIGALLVVIPNLPTHVETFVRSFNQTEPIYPNVYFPVPNPSVDNTEFYRALMYFCLTFGIFQIVLLILRFALKSSLHRKAETLGGVVFWFGVGIFANVLVTDGSTFWFLFIGGLVVSIGLSIMVRAVVAMFS